MANYEPKLWLSQNNALADMEAHEHTPQLLRLMLRNLPLNPEKTDISMNQPGEFWYWKLSYYALELMRALIRSSSSAFSYTHTFMEAEPENIPQLVLLREINLGIQNQMEGENYKRIWKTIFDFSPYLHEKGVSIDPVLFQREIDDLLLRIRQGVFEQSGDRRIYASVRDLLMDKPEQI